MLGKVFFCLPQTQIQIAQGRAAVAGNESASVQPGAAVPVFLQHGQTHQGLGATHIDAAPFQAIFVVNGGILQGILCHFR